MSKVVLITGASSGIGKSIAEFLLEKGMKVYTIGIGGAQDAKIPLGNSGVGRMRYQMNRYVAFLLLIGEEYKFFGFWRTRLQM